MWTDSVGRLMPHSYDNRRLRILVSAYACEPGKGSEPAVGWTTAMELAAHADTYVITRENNRTAIESRMGTITDVARPNFIYFDLPAWLIRWKRGALGKRLYYLIWQACIYFVARALDRKIRFDLTHHITFAQYWTPSFLCFLRPPFVWGPVGGGESAPVAVIGSLGWRGCAEEVLRNTARWLSEWNPLVRQTASRAALAFGSTPETCSRLRAIGARNVSCLSQLDLSSDDLQQFHLPNSPTEGVPLRFISISRLLPWKGFHFAIEALAQVPDPTAEYWLVGDGPDRRRLELLAKRLGLSERVKILGWVPRRNIPAHLSQAHVFLLPSLHDSANMACMEAMATGRPVVCLGLGGPAMQVAEGCGYQVQARTHAGVVKGLAAAMTRFAENPALAASMGRKARIHALSLHGTGRKTSAILNGYRNSLKFPQ